MEKSAASLASDNLEDILYSVEGGFLNNDDDFITEIEEIAAEVPGDEEIAFDFKCYVCEKACRCEKAVIIHYVLLKEQEHSALLSDMALSKQLAKCSVGNFLSEDCHLLTLTRENGFKSLTEMSEKERGLVRLRTMIDSIDSQFLICFHHEQSILQQYKTLQTKCCDPLHTHTRKLYKAH